MGRAGQIEQRILTLGDSDDVYIVVKSGLTEGDEVLLNPLDSLEEAQREAFQAFEPTEDGILKDSEGESVGEKASSPQGGQGVL